MKTSTGSSHRPGSISAFFIYKAGLLAVCFWSWLGFLAVRGGSVTGWHLVATTGAITTTLLGIALGVRYFLQRDAASRHEEIMKNLVELSWNAFAASPPPPTATSYPAAAGEHSGSMNGSMNGDADVIQLTQDLRPRPRR